MKKELLLLSVVMVALSAKAQDPIMYINFEDEATDQTGNFNHLTVKGDGLVYNDADPISNESGKYADLTANVPGTNPGVAWFTGPGMDFTNKSYTMTCWFKFPQKDDPGQILFHENGNGEGETYTIYKVFGNNDGFWGSHRYTNWDYTRPASENGLMDWTHMAIVFDKTVIKYYFNGEPAPNNDGEPVVVDFSFTQDFTDQILMIGAFNNGNSPSKVLLDEMYLFEEVLTLEQINANMNEALETGVGIKPNNAPGINIYPNPASNNVNIRLESQDSAIISLISLDGKKVKTVSTSDKLTNLNLNNISSGVYILKVQTNNKNFSKKIIIK